MTHPTTGGGGTTGPGRRQATALNTEQRTDNYQRQTGARELTPRQRRRRDHKANRAQVRAA